MSNLGYDQILRSLEGLSLKAYYRLMVNGIKIDCTRLKNIENTTAYIYMSSF